MCRTNVWIILGLMCKLASYRCVIYIADCMKSTTKLKITFFFFFFLSIIVEVDAWVFKTSQPSTFLVGRSPLLLLFGWIQVLNLLPKELYSQKRKQETHTPIVKIIWPTFDAPSLVETSKQSTSDLREAFCHIEDGS